MIEIRDVSKSFETVTALRSVNLELKDGEVFGLIGTNGAGKSTLLRILAGILRPDAGQVFADGTPIYEMPETKKEIFYVSDDQYFFPNATPAEMIRYYRTFYPAFDTEKMTETLEDFGLDKTRKIATFSKGMKRQVMLLAGVFSGAKYLLLDETFDGLDPVMRQAAKSLIAGRMVDGGLTPVIASHNLRELEDICDRVGLLHEGGILLSKDLMELRSGIHRVQCVLKEGMRARDLAGLDIIRRESRGRVNILTVRGEEEEIRHLIEGYEPVFYEMLPLSLEEIFISETEVAGYDIKALIF